MTNVEVKEISGDIVEWYELLLEYKRKYTFCAVSQIFINS